MTSSVLLRLLLVFSLSLELFSGCAGHPEIRSVTQDVMDTHVFHKNDRVIDKEELWGKPLKDPQADQYVNSIRERLEKYTTQSAGHIDILDGDLVNGRMSWGSVELTRGMLNACRNEAEIAAYIGHELGHFDKFVHATEEKKSFLRTLANQAINYVPDSTGGINEARTQEADIYAARQSQAKEQAADEFGAELAAKAGYDAYALADLFDRLAAMVTTNPVLYKLAKLKGSHKALSVRATHLRKYLADKHYKRTNRFYAQRYAASLDSLAKSEQGAAPAAIPAGLSTELAGFQSEVNQHRKDHQPLSAERFLVIMKRLSEISQAYPSTAAHRRRLYRPALKAFMEEALYMDTPSWSGMGGGIGSLVQGVLSGLGHLAVAGMPEVGSAAALYELMSGKNFVTGQDLGLHGAGLAVVGLLALGATGAGIASAISEAGAAIDGAAAAEALQAGEAMEKGIEASPTLAKIAQSPDFVPTDYYVRPNGDVIPATGYRYLGEDVQGIDNILQTGEVPPRIDPTRPNYISFDDFSNESQAQSGLQLKQMPRYKITFNTEQVVDSLQIPRGEWGTADYLEPITSSFPGYGSGGATQAVTQG